MHRSGGLPAGVPGTEVEQLGRVRRWVIVVTALVENLSVNPAAADRPPNWQDAYYGQNLTRLKATRERVDPHHYFNFPQAIGR